MKKANLIIIATIVAALAISMFAFQTTNIEAKNDPVPTVMPTPRKFKVPKSVMISLEKASVERRAKPSRTKVKNPSTVSSPQTTIRQQFNPKEIGIDKLKNPGQTNGKTTQPNDYIGETEKNVMKPMTRRRQNNQTNAGAPTKSLMTIPTDVPNATTKKAPFRRRHGR